MNQLLPLNSKPSNLGCLVYPLSGTAGFIVFLLLFAAMGFSALFSFWIATAGAFVGLFIARVLLRSDKIKP